MAYLPVLSDIAQYRDRLSTLICKEIGVAAATINVEHNLADYGLDSLSALVITGEIEDTFGIELEETTLWDHPTVAAIAAYVRERALAREAQVDSEACVPA